jgi:hypothetical protein
MPAGTFPGPPHGFINNILFGKRDRKDLRLDTAQLLNRYPIDCHR